MLVPAVSAEPSEALASSGYAVPYFPSLAIACGHFKDAGVEADMAGVIEGCETIAVPEAAFSRAMIQRPHDYFVCRAVGDSMQGGKDPVSDGDYLLLQWISPSRAGSLRHERVVVHRPNESGDDTLVLRRVYKRGEGEYELRADNPDQERYEPFMVGGEEGGCDGDDGCGGVTSLAVLRGVWRG